MRLTFGDGFESWRIALIATGIGIAFAGTFMLGGLGGPDSSMGPKIAAGAVAVVGLLMVVAGLIGRQTSTRGDWGFFPVLIYFVVLPVVAYLAKLSTGWKLILAAWCVVCVAAAVVIARRRA
jgi:hypothetical protein